MVYYRSKFIFILLTSFSLFSGFECYKVLCRRIFFKNINVVHEFLDRVVEPYQFIEGVYVRQDYRYNDFPVYKRENGNLLLYLDNKRSSLLFGVKLGSYFGVGIRLMSYSNSPSPSEWLATGSLNRNSVFQGLASNWYSEIHSQPYGHETQFKGGNVQAICVDENFRACLSGRIYLPSEIKDTDGNIINNPKEDYFYQLTNQTRDLRPVYRHSRFNLYLQYESHSWVMFKTVRAMSESGFEDVRSNLLRSSESPLRPEFTNYSWTDSFWNFRKPFRFMCKGIGSHTDLCGNNPCSEGSTCVFTSYNETLCICSKGHFGSTCEKTIKCPPLPKSDNGTFITYKVLEDIPGSIAMGFCKTNHRPFSYRVCNINPFGNKTYWSKHTTCSREYQDHNDCHNTVKPNVRLDIYTIVCLILNGFSQVLILFSKKLISTRSSASCYVFSFAWLALTIVLKDKTSYTTYHIVSICLLALCIVVVIIESVFSEECIEIRNFQYDSESATACIHRLKTSTPVVTATVNCYHIKRNWTHANTRVITFRKNVEFPIQSWINDSEGSEESDVSEPPLTRLLIERKFTFGDRETEAKAQEFVDEIMRIYQHKDQLIKVDWNLSTTGNTKLMVTNENTKPLEFNIRCFWIALGLYMIWPYRWYIRLSTSNRKLIIRKKVYSNGIGDMSQTTLRPRVVDGSATNHQPPSYDTVVEQPPSYLDVINNASTNHTQPQPYLEMIRTESSNHTPEFYSQNVELQGQDEQSPPYLEMIRTESTNHTPESYSQNVELEGQDEQLQPYLEIIRMESSNLSTIIITEL